MVCFIEDLRIPEWLQSQFEHIEWICSCVSFFSSIGVCFFLNIKSIINPITIPIINFSPITLSNKGIQSGWDKSTGIASSEVVRNTATSVPNVITLLAYNVAAVTEKPHWGIVPKNPPITGPNFPERLSVFSIFFEDLCYINSIIKYDKNKNGNIFIESTNVSKIISFINFTSSKCKLFAFRIILFL